MAHSLTYDILRLGQFCGRVYRLTHDVDRTLQQPIVRDGKVFADDAQGEELCARKDRDDRGEEGEAGYAALQERTCHYIEQHRNAEACEAEADERRQP